MRRQNAPGGPPSGDQPKSFGQLARRLSGWTTNLIATGIILVAALGLGRELVRWWQVAPEDAAPRPLAELESAGGQPGQSATLEFGDSPQRIERRLVQGDRGHARQMLLDACRGAARNTAPPAGDADAAEARLLETVQSLESLESSGGLRLYGPDIGLPMIVAVREAEPAGKAGDSGQLGASRNRVLVWGIAAPAGAQAWSLYVCRLGSAASAQIPVVPAVPLPPGSRRSMSLGTGPGESLTAFTGSGEPHEWRRFFADALPAAEWRLTEAWQWEAGVWHARYERKIDTGRANLEIQFGPDARGRLTGLVRTELAADANEREREPK